MIQDNELQEKLNRLGQTLGRAPSIAEDVMREIERSTTPQHSTARRVRERLFKMNRISRIAAAILIVAAIAGAAAWLTIGNGGATVAWADVQEHIRNARTMTFKMAVEMESLPNMLMEMEITMMFKEPGLMRMETTMGSSKIITIMDIRQNKMVLLMEAQKKASIIDLTELPAEIRKKYEEQNFLAGIKKMIEESETELGEKEIDGQAVKGYRVAKGNQVFTIWADTETGQPVEMNLTMFQGESETTISDFEFDVELDDALFSLDIPEGYTVDEKSIEIKEASADDVVALLRMWSKLRGGTFPDALTPAGIGKDIQDFKHVKFDDEKSTKDDGLVDVYSMTRAWMLLIQHSEAHYAGKGVKFGDADRAIFWYRPEGSETYRVIYGDLRIEDVAEEDLPMVEGETEASETPTTAPAAN